MEIVKAQESYIPEIIALANKTWHATYTQLVAAGQIEYMLNLFYNEALMKEQIKDPLHHFLLLLDEGKLVAYAHGIEQNGKVKLSKLYCLPEVQGKGFGKILMQAMEAKVIELGYDTIELYVNRGNSAQLFYEKQGFIVIREEDVPIGAYWMNDYVMQKKLQA